METERDVEAREEGGGFGCRPQERGPGLRGRKRVENEKDVETETSSAAVTLT